MVGGGVRRRHARGVGPLVRRRPIGTGDVILRMAAAVGSGPTELAAFDDALLQVGAANYNLVRLSSVIPPGSQIADGPGAIESPGGAWGDRLYVVYAEQRASTRGEEAWAGVGWVQDEFGRGLFVEHEGGCEVEVRRQIDASLAQLVRGRGLTFDRPRQRTVGGIVVDRPICALVLCAFETEAWAASRPSARRREPARERLQPC